MGTGKKRILIFIDWFDPAYKAGGPVVSVLNLVQALNKEFIFFVFTGSREYGDQKPLPVITDVWTDHPSGARVCYCSRPGQGIIRSSVRQCNPDLIYINGMFSWCFSVLPLILTRRLAIPVIVAPRGMLSPGSLAIKKYKKWPFLQVMKLAGFYKNIVFQATGEVEAADISRMIGSKNRLFIAPNFPDNMIPVPATRIKKPGELKLIFVGRVAPEKNLLYAIERVLCFEPSVTLDIYGPIYHTAYFNKCFLLVRTRQRDSQIRYLGELPPNELKMCFKNYHALLLPTTGENYGHAIVESLSSGLPVLISDRTPWRSLPEKKAGFVISLDQVDKWIEALEALKNMDQSVYDEWSAAAGKYALNVMDNEQTREQNRQLFRQTMND